MCKGIIPQLHHRYDMGVSGTKAAWLAVDTDHYASTVGDAGWGCGYRNLQMLISSLLRIDIYRSVMFSGEFVSGSVAAAQKSCRDWIKQTVVFIVDSFCCFVSIVSRSIVSIQLD